MQDSVSYKCPIILPILFHRTMIPHRFTVNSDFFIKTILKLILASWLFYGYFVGSQSLKLFLTEYICYLVNPASTDRILLID